MPAEIRLLAIDDDRLSQKIIRRSLDTDEVDVDIANDGESGIAAALAEPPDAILLDVEMPGLNGYEVCERLRAEPPTREVPIIFLSSHSSLRERMLGYEAGGDDYLVKPFERDNLLARIRVLIRFRNQRKELAAQYEVAQKVAHVALSSTSELAQVVQFVEKSYAYRSTAELASGVFDVTEQLGLSCCMAVREEGGDGEAEVPASQVGGEQWFSSDGVISPLERELIEMSDRQQRFVDFNDNTLISYEHISLLVRNMPLDDRERYGRLKDLLPVLLSASEAKLNAISVERMLLDQGRQMLTAFARIRTDFYHLAKDLIGSQEQATKLLREMVGNLNYDLLRMGLEEDQEEYLVARIDGAVDEAVTGIDANAAIYTAFTAVQDNLKRMVRQQEAVVEACTPPAPVEQTAPEDDDDIELF